MPRPHPRQGLAEALLIEGLQEVVHRADLEGLERVGIVSRDEHDRRELIRRERPRQINTVQRVHLNVEKQQLRPLRAHGGERGGTVAELAHHVEIALGRAEFPQRAPPGQLVVHDDDVQHQPLLHAAVRVDARRALRGSGEA
jgi:hypothetical protein